jgi:ribose/xylose/arabinose/galactoside ABC-type transport system permease subunit
VIVGSAIAEPQFLTTANLFNLLRQVAPNCIVATGMAIVIIAGGIDLSVGAMLSLGGVIAVAAQPSFGYGLGILFALLAGAAAGLTNGLLVTRLRINAFIGTLGVMTIVRGVALTLSRSHTLPGQDPAFAALADRPIVGIPASTVLAFALFLAGHYFMSSTPAGRSIYAVGGSLEASRLAGLRVERSLLFAYLSSAVAAALAGVVVASEINSGSPVLGNDTPLSAIAAVLLGGISMRGGSGTMIGMLQGVLILGVLTNGLNISGVGGFYQIVVVGSLLILTVVLDRLVPRKSRRK